MKRAPATSSAASDACAAPHAKAGIDSVRIRAKDGTFVEVAILDPKKPRDLELAVVRDHAPTAWTVIDLNDLLSAIQVIRSTGGES